MPNTMHSSHTAQHSASSEHNNNNLFLSFCRSVVVASVSACFILSMNQHGRYECCCQWFDRLTAASRIFSTDSRLAYAPHTHHTIRMYLSSGGDANLEGKNSTFPKTQNSRLWMFVAFQISQSNCYWNVHAHFPLVIATIRSRFTCEKPNFHSDKFFFSLSHVDANWLNV